MYFSTPRSGRSALARAGRKAVALAVTGAMATMLIPAAAFAHYAPNNSSGKALLLDQSTDSWDGALKKKVNADGSVTYTGIAHSDLSHYAAYDLTTTITTDSNKKITAINLTSGDDTFSGSWGTKRGSAHGSQIVEGYLPDGVDFSATKNEDGTFTLNLTGASKYRTATVTAPRGTASVEGYSANASGATAVMVDELNEDGTVKVDEEGNAVKKSAVSYDEATNRVTIDPEAADEVNLIRVTYKIGAESIYFNTYFPTNEEGTPAEEDADAYLDTIEPTTWDSDEELSEIAVTNRDRWTAIMGTIYQQRTLQSWGAFLEDESLDSEIDDLDTVSGATKTSEPFVAALNQAVLDGHVTGVAEDVAFTIDGGKDNEIDVNTDPKDLSTVSVNESGQYVLDNIFPYGEVVGGRSTSLNEVTVYRTGKSLTTKEVQEMAKGRSSYESVSYTPTSLELNPTPRTNRDGTPMVDSEGNQVYSYSWGDFATNLIDFKYQDSGRQRVITALDDSVDAIALSFTIGHATITVAYDLDQMKAAGDVKAQIESMGNEPSKIVAARAAYNALNTDVRGFVSNVSKLKAAEAGLTLNRASVTLSQKSYTYNGSAKRPAVTVKLGNTTLRAGVDYSLSYSRNTNAGTASVTVTGKGSYKGSKTASFTIAKASQSLKVSTAKKSVKAKAVKKKKQATSKVKVTGAKTNASYKKAGGSKKLTINSKTGKITVKKGTKKGTYKIKVKVSAAASSNYKAASKTVTVKVVVK